MTPEQIALYRHVAAEGRATAYPVPSRMQLAETVASLCDEVDRLRAVEAAGERLADVCRDVHFSEWTGDGYTIVDLGAALDAWEAARRGDAAP